MQETHWKVFHCPFGCPEIFHSMDDCRVHVTRDHLTSPDNQDLTTLLEVCARPMAFKSGFECPLCREHLGSIAVYKRHVGRHQEQLALFALPSQDEQDQDENDASNEDEQDRDENESSNQDKQDQEENDASDEDKHKTNSVVSSTNRGPSSSTTCVRSARRSKRNSSRNNILRYKCPHRSIMRQWKN